MKRSQHLIALGLMVSAMHAAVPSEFDINHDSINAALADLQASETSIQTDDQTSSDLNLSKINSSSENQPSVNFVLLEGTVQRLEETIQLACKQINDVKVQLAEVKQAAADQAKINHIQSQALADDLKNTQSQLSQAQEKIDQQAAAISNGVEVATDDQSDVECIPEDLDEDCTDEVIEEPVGSEVSADVDNVQEVEA
jgi:chromosome segregation ATPase